MQVIEGENNMSKELYPESVSMLADGELQGAALDQVMAHLAASPEARHTWDSYHLVGEVMRSGRANVRAHDPEFVQKLHRKLNQDDIKFVAISTIPTGATGQKLINIQSANDSRWQRLAGLAAVLMVSVLAWQGYGLLGADSPTAAAQLAQRAVDPPTSAQALIAPTPASSEAAPVMLRDARLDALLAAHRQFGGTSALQTPSGFLRNATFEAGQH